MLLGGAPFKSRMATSAVLRARLVNGHHRSADHPRAEVDALHPKQGRIRRRVKLGEHSLVRIRPALRVGAEGQIEDRRIAWKARTAAQDLRQGQFLGPDERQPVLKSLELFIELSTPESAEQSGPHHHEDLPGLRQQLQDFIDQPGIIVDDRDGGFVLAQWRVSQKSLIDSRKQERRVGKELLSIPAREYGRRAADRHDEVRLGTIGEDGLGCSRRPPALARRQTQSGRRRPGRRSRVSRRARPARHGSGR